MEFKEADLYMKKLLFNRAPVGFGHALPFHIYQLPFPTC
jgi:hypothetical protein